YRRSVSCAIDVCAYPWGQANVTAQLPRSVKPSTSNPVITRRKQGRQGILAAQSTSVHKTIFVAIRHTRHRQYLEIPTISVALNLIAVESITQNIHIGSKSLKGDIGSRAKLGISTEAMAQLRPKGYARLFQTRPRIARAI